MKTVQRNQGLVSTKEITESLIKLFEFDEKDEDSFIEEIKVEERFGKAIYQLIQKIGGFDSTVLSLGATLFEKKVSRICSASLINLKTNRYQFFFSLLKEAHAKFTDEKFVEEWIDGDNIQTTSEKNLHQVAALTHDMIMLGSGGWGGAVRLVIGKTPRYLEKTIKKIIHTLFGHQFCNINLLGQIQEVVIEALKDSFRQFSQSYVPLQEGREIESLLTSHRLKEGGI